MNAIKTILALTVLPLTILTAPGCDGGDDAGMVGGRAYPPVGSYVHVQFRRNYLGIAGEKPTTPSGEGMGMALASSGELKRVTDDFIVLQVDNEPDRELWIPRETVLLLDVRRKQ